MVKIRAKQDQITLKSFNGDHGSGTPKANAGTYLEEVLTEDGRNPNRYARRRRINQIEELSKKGVLTLRQYQAAMIIQDAYCETEALSSGGPLKERVDQSVRPDAVIADQVHVMSHWIYVARCIPADGYAVVKTVVMENKPISRMGKGGRAMAQNREQLLRALDVVADRMKI